MVMPVSEAGAKIPDAESQRSSKGGQMVAIAALLLLYPVLGSLLPATLNAATFILGTVAVAANVLLVRSSLRTYIHPIWIGWSFLGLLTVTSYLVALVPPTVPLNQAVIFALSILVAMLLSSFDGWQAPLLKVLVAFLAVHALATIVFAIFPDLYLEVVRPRLFPTPRTLMDYRDALTPNRTQNAVFVGLGLTTSATAMFATLPLRKVGVIRWVWPMIFLLALLLTTVRGPLVYAVLASVLVFVMLQERNGVARAVPVVLVTSVVLFVLSRAFPEIGDSLGRLLSTFEEDDLAVATSGRTELWEHALAGWRDHPWFGSGWRTFEHTYAGSGTTRELAHNQILNSLFETGLLGTGLYVIGAGGSLIIVGRSLRRIVGDSNSGSDRLFLSVSLAVQIFYLLYANTTGQLLSKPYTFIPYFVAIAIGFATSHKSEFRIASQSGGGAAMYK